MWAVLTAGLTGGLACGKTFVAKELHRLGAHIIHADALGHEVLTPSGEAYTPTLHRFGHEILDEDCLINRARLADVVFGDPEKLAALNAIVHPAVIRREDELLAGIGAQDPGAVAIVEAAILIETGFYERFDKLIVVVCEEEQQVERAMGRGAGVTRTGVLARLSRQMPMAEKRRFADYVIDSSGTEEETLRQTRDVWLKLRAASGLPDAPRT